MNFNPSFYTSVDEISTSESNMYCFYDDSSVSISNTSYSRQITGDTVFGIPIQATVLLKYISFSLFTVIIFSSFQEVTLLIWIFLEWTTCFSFLLKYLPRKSLHFLINILSMILALFPWGSKLFLPIFQIH